MKKIRLLLYLLVLLCSCNDDIPADVINIFETFPVPSIPSSDGSYIKPTVGYSTITFTARVMNPKRNAKWCAYYSDKPNVGPDNGQCIELPDPYESAMKKFQESLGNVGVANCAEVTVDISDLKPSTAYYYNVFYTDENSRTCIGQEVKATTKDLRVGTLIGYDTDVSSATVCFIVTACVPEKTECFIYISEKDHCPVEDARLVCKRSLEGSKFEYGEITSSVQVDGLKFGTRYYLQGYMVCLGDTVHFPSSSFNMSRFRPGLMGASTDLNKLLVDWSYSFHNGSGYEVYIPEDLPPYDLTLWVSKQSDPIADPDAMVFKNEEIPIKTTETQLHCSKLIEGLEPFTTYYAVAEMGIDGNTYRCGPQSAKTKHAMTVFDGQERALVYLQDGTSFEVVLVKAGKFMMGATFEQEAYAGPEERPVHEVSITKDFYIAVCETTSSLYKKLSYGGKGEGDYPIRNVSCEQVSTFCNALSKQIGYNVTLPTEAEWEYAARGGHLSPAQTLYAGSDNLADIAVSRNSITDTETKKVATKQPNALGLYDMSGNVWELCSDKYEDDFYSRSESTDPVNPNNRFSEIPYVVRGGSCMYEEQDLDSRVSSRWWMENDYWSSSHPFVGFRFVIRP